MKINFDYYHNLESVELYLCNPDGRELYVLPGMNRKLKLRFNDLSELSFDVYHTVTDTEGKTLKTESYDYIAGMRLVRATGIGWFKISGVTENDNGAVKYKSVTCESLQAEFKNKGFYSEERVYCFYNPQDENDSRYNAGKFGDIPSVVGQLYSQLGIQHDLSQGLDDPDTPYDEWTITYVNPKLVFNGTTGECRTFKDGTTFGYDWIVKEVEDAFGIIAVFDFLNKTIKFMYPSEVAVLSGVVYSFSNFMKNAEVDEDTSELVTVLDCTGNNCDIASVNPMGTTYLCDFSYYMDEKDNKWMSPALIAKLKQWQAFVDAKKERYKELVEQLQSKYFEKAQEESQLTSASLALADLKTARDKKLEAGMNPNAVGLTGVVTAETVDAGETSDDSGSSFYSTPFSGNSTIVGYKTAPTYDNGRWSFSDTGRTATAESNFADGYVYFIDGAGKSYCKLLGTATVNTSEITAEYHCGGFDRYINYGDVNSWIGIKEGKVEEVNSSISSADTGIGSIESELAEIASTCNILRYFADTPLLLKELTRYWIEGDYNNSNFAILEKTSASEGLDIATQLMEAGQAELAKVSQPHYSFSVESIDVTKLYEFREQAAHLNLGQVVTVEKEEGLWFYPALLEIELDLDSPDNFTLRFANALRLDDWGYTYADLVSSSAAVARKVNANWQNITDYAKNKESISGMIQDPLNATLRAATANMHNQEFTVDSTGVLGRKKKTTSGGSAVFEPEQMRIMNNMLIFTDDNWETAKAALGKIRYTDESGAEVSAYGLIADTIIGSLLVGEHLIIQNGNGTVSIDGSGITITDDSGNPLFSASSKGLSIKNYATSEDLENTENYLASEFSVTAEGLSSRVTTAEGEISRIDQKADAIVTAVLNADGRISTVEQQADSIESRVTTVEGDYASVAERVTDNESHIGLIVKNGVADAGLIIRAINDGDSEVVISADKIDLSGLLTVSDLESGTTTIDGACIKTGTISSDRIDVSNLTVNVLNVTGAVKMGDDDVTLAGLFNKMNEHISYHVPFEHNLNNDLGVLEAYVQGTGDKADFIPSDEGRHEQRITALETKVRSMDEDFESRLQELESAVLG